MKVSIPLSITSDLSGGFGSIPFSPTIDFAEAIRSTGMEGCLDPNSISVIDVATSSSVSPARTEDFAYGDSGRIEWIVTDPSHVEYEIHFEIVDRRPQLEPQDHVPMIGTGDLLRYNAGEPRPVTTSYSMALKDMMGNGRADLVGVWNYYYRPGDPRSGVICYPRVGGNDESFLFGDLLRMHYIEDRENLELKDFEGTYVQADFADFDGDGLVDIAFAEMQEDAVTIFLNTGEREPGGQPIFVKSARVPAPVAQIAGICAVDLDGNGILDLVVNGHFVRNRNPNGWPFEAEEPIDLGIGKRLTFLDLDGDGRPDAMGLPVAGVEHALTWRRNLGGNPPTFGQEEHLRADTGPVSSVSANDDGGGILVQENSCQTISRYELGLSEKEPELVRPERLMSRSAVLALSDQAWPCLCDWDGNGVTDLLVGGGYGWPRILLNRGNNERPELTEAEMIHGDGSPIRIQRDEVLSSNHWHNMGYPYPVFVDWDGDGLKDLVLPNETNRIIWHKNIGTEEEPKFGARKYLEVEGYPDSDESRAETGRMCEDPDVPNSPYPYDPSSPFFWRTGAAFADWNDDGLMDFITHDEDRKATLFAQLPEQTGSLRLVKAGRVKLVDGREIDDSIVGREKHWTETFRSVDWDGDGLIDLVYNCAGSGKIYLLRNVGSKSEPVFDLPREFKCYGEEIAFTIHGPNAWPGDLNGDGKPDLLGCVEWSVYPFYAHAALEMEKHPEYRIGEPKEIGNRKISNLQ